MYNKSGIGATLTIFVPVADAVLSSKHSGVQEVEEEGWHLARSRVSEEVGSEG